jgi:hypothetical protein
MLAIHPVHYNFYPGWARAKFEIAELFSSFNEFRFEGDSVQLLLNYLII